jgi:O-antigen ligase
MFYSQIRSREEVKYYILGIVTSSLAMAVSSIVNLIRTGFSFGMLGDNYHFRTSGIFANANASAGYIAVAFPLLLVSLFYLKEKKYLLIVWILIIIEIIGVITLTSRGGMLSMICSSILILYVFKKKYLISLTLIIIPTVLIILFSPIGKMFELFFRLEQGLANRDELWKLSFEMVKHNLFFGVGPGGWGNEMFNYFPVMLDSFTGQQFVDLYNVAHGVNASHNFYLLFFTDMGILGLFTAIVFPVVYFKICYKSIVVYVNSIREYYLLLIAAAAIGFGMFIRGFFEGISLITYGELSVDIPMWLIIAIIAFLHQNNKKLSYLLS